MAQPQGAAFKEQAAMEWIAPGPGLWTHDKVHFNFRPSRLTLEAREWAAEGMRDSLRRYGALGDGADPAEVNGFMFGRPRSVITGVEGETQAEFTARANDIPAVRERFQNAEVALSTRLWEEDLRRWDFQLKPTVRAANTALARVDPASLTDRDLADFIDECLKHWKVACMLHHVPNGAVTVPGGMLLAFIQDATGQPAASGVDLFAGSVEVSGPSSPEARALRQAVQGDKEAWRWVEGHDADEALIRGLRAWPGSVGAAVERHLRHAGFGLSGGLDINSPCALERPAVLAASIKAIVAGDDSAPPKQPDLAAWRELVPEARWEEFLGLLDAARRVYRLRDERGAYCNGPARGIARMALLEAGSRLTQRGLLNSPDDLLEAGSGEIEGLFSTAGGPTADELGKRARWREEGRELEVPSSLGKPDALPVPVAWLPPAAQQVARALAAHIAGGTQTGASPPAGVIGRELKGVGASRGSFSGHAAVVQTLDDLDRVEPGAVLVTETTSSSFNVVFPLLGAIVTDFGGALCHAAIMAREFGIPCVTGVPGASRTIRDGEAVTVDGDNGVVRLSREVAS